MSQISEAEKPIDWQEVKEEFEVCKETMEEVQKEKSNPLNELMFGIGQPLRTYWQNGDLTKCRFEGYSENFLWNMRWACLIPCLIWSIFTIITMQGRWVEYFWYWTYWGWFIAIISQILTLLAQHNPNYWHVTAYAWLEATQGLSLGVTFGFWIVLMPMIYEMFKFEDIMQWTFFQWLIWMHMVILHGVPIIMTTLNCYYSDIKIMKVDWKLTVWHGFFYTFANFLGGYDMGHAVYPLITWDSYPQTFSLMIFGSFVMAGFYYLFASWAEKNLKRRGEK